MRTHAQAVVIGGGLIGCSILYHLAKHRLVRRRPARARRADLRLDLARGRQHPWPARLHQHQPPAALHHGALQGAGDRDRPGLRHLPAGLALSRPDRGARASAAAAGSQGAALQDEFLRGRARRGGAAASAGRFRRHPLHHVRAGRRQCRSVRRHRRLRRRRAPARRRDPPLHAGHRHGSAAGRQLDRAHAQGRRSARNGWSTPPACGAARSPPWPACSCR